jgi:hypothetical protein
LHHNKKHKLSNNQNNKKMTKLQLIKNNLNNAIRVMITSNELDLEFDRITSNYLFAEHNAPFTTVEIQAAQRLALKEMVLSIKK